jgi:hypothetical protein
MQRPAMNAPRPGFAAPAQRAIGPELDAFAGETGVATIKAWHVSPLGCQREDTP